MMSSQKKPGVAFWATVVVVVVLLAYPLSFGPACWLTSQRLSPGLYREDAKPPPRAMFIYYPLGGLANEPDSAPGRALIWYIQIGVPRGCDVAVPVSTTGYTLCRSRS